MNLMFRIASVAVAAVVAASAVIAQSGQKTALVTVIAEGAGPEKGLTPADFVVREDGRTYEVLGAQLAEEPLFVSILVDTSQPPTDVPSTAVAHHNRIRSL